MKTILVPTDFSDQAKYATDLAATLAEKMNAKLILLHVVEDTSVAMVHYTGELAMPNIEDRLYIYKLIEHAKQEFSDIHDQYKGVKIKEEIRVGNPYYSIQEIVSEHKVDMIVMGTKGASGMKEFIIGSNAEKVVRHATCPVLTVHDKVENLNIKKVAFATGLQDVDGQHVDVIKEFKELFDFSVSLVRVNTPNNFQTDRDSLNQLKKYVEQSGLTNCELRIYNDVTEEEGIINFAEEIDADLIVMATHGRTGFAHLIAGSIAEEVVNHTKRPVLTFSMSKKKKATA